MIRKGNDYDKTTAFGQSDYKTLPKGGYVCRIIDAKETEDKNGNPLVHFIFDIIDGDYNGFFMNLFNTRKQNNTDPQRTVKYPFEGQMWIPVNDYEDSRKTNRKFKALCTALEDSGTEVWGNDEFILNNLKGAQIGIVFQNVETEYEGKTYWKAVPWGCRSVGAIDSGDYYIPDDKPLAKTNTNYNGFSATDDDIPF